MCVERRVEVPGGALHSRMDGDGGRPPLALVNMAQSNLGAWDPLVALLTDRFRVLRHDIRGTGASIAEGPSRFDRYADDLALVLDAWAITRATICGAAYGARTAMAFALRHPHRVERLILLDAAVGPPAVPAVREAGRARAAARRAAAGMARVEVAPAWLVHADPARAALAYRAHLDAMPWEAQIEMIAAPTLVATGDEDPNLAVSRQIAARIPGAAFALLDMVGHGSPIERPELLAELIAG